MMWLVNCDPYKWNLWIHALSENEFGHCISTKNRIKMLQNINREYNQIIKHSNT